MIAITDFVAPYLLQDDNILFSWLNTNNKERSMKPRLQIASGIFHGFMYIDPQLLLDKPMEFAQRSLLLADALIASEALSDPTGPAESSVAPSMDPADEEFLRHALTKAARARFDFNLDARRAMASLSLDRRRLN